MVGRAVAVEEFTGFVGQSEWYFFGLGNKGKAGAYPKCWICSCVGEPEIWSSASWQFVSCAEFSAPPRDLRESEEEEEEERHIEGF